MLELSIPHTVDQGVQHGGDEGVDHRHYLGPLWRVAGAGAQVDEAGASILEQNHSHVGGAGGEGFVPPFCRADLQDGGRDEDIGQGDQQEGEGKDSDANHEQRGLVDPGVHTGQSHDGQDITVEHANLLAAAEGEPQDEHGQLHGQDEPQHQGAQGQSGTQPPAHHEAVTQRVADGHEPVVGHDGQQDAVSAAQEDEEEHLGTAASQGDEGSPRGQGAGQCQRGNGGGVAGLQSRQVGQEEVHGGVQRAVGPDDEQNGDVAADADQVHNQEGHENQRLNLREFGEGAEVEVNHRPGPVRVLHVVHASGLLTVQALPLRIAKRQDAGVLLADPLSSASLPSFLSSSRRSLQTQRLPSSTVL